MAQAAHPALAGVLSLSAMCRTFLGPHKGAKCIVHEPAAGAKPAAAAERSTLVTSAEQLLHAIDGDPSSTTLLLEFMDAQASDTHMTRVWTERQSSEMALLTRAEDLPTCVGAPASRRCGHAAGARLG